MLAFVLIYIGMFLMAPSDILNFSDHLWIFLVGQGIVEGA
jgi:hypothetical protein